MTDKEVIREAYFALAKLPKSVINNKTTTAMNWLDVGTCLQMQCNATKKRDNGNITNLG